MRYIAKPRLFNKTDSKEFDNPIDAIKYLNEYMSAKEGDHEDYVFIAPSTSKKQLKKSIDEYVGIGKLEIITE